MYRFYFRIVKSSYETIYRSLKGRFNKSLLTKLPRLIIKFSKYDETIKLTTFA